MKFSFAMSPIAIAAALLLAACSNGGGEPADSGAPSASTATQAGPTAGTTAPASAAASDDPYCALMQEGLDTNAELIARIQEGLGSMTAQAIASGDTSLLNETGSKVLELAPRNKDTYAQAAALVDDAAVASDFEAMSQFIDLYAIPVGELMASATDFESVATGLGSLTSAPQVQDLLGSVPTQQQDIEAYSVERCGSSFDVSTT